MQAIIIGATGATGKDLLNILLNDNRYNSVKIFVRKPSGISNPKLEEHIINFDKPEEWKDLVTGDVLFSCLGTTLKAAGSKEAQYKIDYQYQYNFAQTARKNGVKTLSLISSLGASSKSVAFYTKMKGELEDAVQNLKFPKLLIYRPPILDRKNTDRPMEKVSLKIINALNSVGLLKSQKPLATEDLAKTMANNSVIAQDGVHIFSGPELKEISAS